MSHAKQWLETPVDIKGDIGYVLGEGTGDLGSLCVSNNINPLALWKPFQSTEKGFTSASSQRSAMTAVGCGFRPFGSQSATGYPTFALKTWLPEDDNTWTYYRPDGTTYPYRALDFAPLGTYTPVGTTGGMKVGYRHDAGSPIYVEWPKFEETYPNCVIHIGSSGAASGGHWDMYNCLNIGDLFPHGESGGGYNNYHFAILMRRQRGSAFMARTIVISDVSLGDVNQSSGADITLAINKSYAAVTTNLQVNDTIACCVCLVLPAGTIPSGGKTINDNDSDFPNSLAVSLEIKEGCDRIVIDWQGKGSISGLWAGISNLKLNTPATFPSSYTQGYGFYDCKQVNGYVYGSNNALSLGIDASSCNDWDRLSSYDINCTLTFWTEGAVLCDDNGTIGSRIAYPFSGYFTPTSDFDESYLFGNTFPGSTFPYNLYLLKTISSGTQTLYAQFTFKYDVELKLPSTPASVTI